MATELDPASERLLVAQVRVRNAGLRGAAALLFVICFGGGILSYLLADPRLVKVIAGAGFGVLLALMLVLPTLGDPKRHGAITALRERAASVVWLYVSYPRRPPWTEASWARSMPGVVKASILFVCMDDGRRLPFDVRAGDEDAVLDLARRLAPAAVVGWSAETDARYRQSPASLRDGSAAR
jgi:hypothetical protein